MTAHCRNDCLPWQTLPLAQGNWIHHQVDNLCGVKRCWYINKTKRKWTENQKLFVSVYVLGENTKECLSKIKWR